MKKMIIVLALVLGTAALSLAAEKKDRYEYNKYVDVSTSDKRIAEDRQTGQTQKKINTYVDSMNNNKSTYAPRNNSDTRVYDGSRGAKTISK